MFVTEGTVEGGGLLAALRSIASGNLAGLLAVQGDQDLVSVAFLSGNIVAVDAMNRPMEEALSEVLASRGLVAPQSFAAAVDPILGTGRLAGDVLLEAELLERDQLLDAVREQVREQALQLLRWERGVFSWSAGAESPYQSGMEPLSVAELIVRAKEQQGDSSPFGAPVVELGDHFAAAGGESPLVLGRDGDWIEEGDTRAWLTPVESQVLGSIDPAQPASYLLLQLGVGSYELRYALQVLVELQLVTRAADANDSAEQAGAGAVRGLLGEDGDISDLLEPSAGGSPTDDLLATFPDDLGGSSLVPGETVAREPSDLKLDTHVLDGPSEWDDHDEWGERLAREEGFFSGSLATLANRFKVDPAGGTKVPRRRESMAQILSTWAARIMALGFVVLLASQVFYRGQRQQLRFPFFWQSEAGARMEGKFWSATVGKIEEALRAYHLLYGRYPDDLEILVDLDLLSPTDLYDSEGRWLAYSMTETGYVLRPAEGERPLEELNRVGGVANDVFLDPKFVLEAGVEEQPELRVLD